MANSNDAAGGSGEPPPPHLSHWPGLFVREGELVVPAPDEDQAVARGYPEWPDKGPVENGNRLTILTGRTQVPVGGEVRVIHVHEVTEPGHEVYVMGPKPVLGEYVNGTLVTALPEGSEDPLKPSLYSGRVVPSPAVDYNFDITAYRFAAPGSYRIDWEIRELRSNSLVIEVR